MEIKKGVITLAGKGTRVLPLTLHQPKGMIALADKPMFHYIVDEFRSTGIREIILVIGPGQQVFKKYINYIRKNSNHWHDLIFHFAVQEKPRGTADAIFQAKPFINRDEGFLVAFCDDLLVKGEKILQEMIKHFQKTKKPVVLLEKVPQKLAHLYGVVETKEFKNNLLKIKRIVEKPKEKPPSAFTIIGRFVFPYEIFEYLAKLYPYKGSELGYYDALNLYAKIKRYFLGYINKTKRFDCGSKSGLIQAQFYFSKHSIR